MTLTANALNAIVQTIVSIPSTDSEYSIPGEMTIEQVKASYSASIPGLSSMEATSRDENRDIGKVRVLTFKPRTGTKGAVSQTLVLIPSTDSEYSIPGEMSADQVKASYSGSIPGLSSMDATTTEANGVRTITFRPRTGTKG